MGACSSFCMGGAPDEPPAVYSPARLLVRGAPTLSRGGSGTEKCRSRRGARVLRGNRALGGTVENFYFYRCRRQFKKSAYMVWWSLLPAIMTDSCTGECFDAASCATVKAAQGLGGGVCAPALRLPDEPVAAGNMYTEGCGKSSFSKRFRQRGI